MGRLILGSQSPRRKDLLGQFSIPFEQATPPFVEEEVPFEGDPVAYVTTLSKGKNESLRRSHPKAIIITADTVVYCKGKVYNKPGDFDEACSFLRTFSGSWQSVFTSVTVGSEHHTHTDYDETKVLFNTLSDEEIARFLNAIHWQDKGGGYTIQGVGNLLVNKIEGCYDNVTGLPVNTLQRLLLKVGINLWDYLAKR